ncbi:MAG: PilX N-terminal domain-containing pilus assembly protein [Chthoniobacteraceae bacterium]
MNPLNPPMFVKRKKAPQGVALILVLVILVILSILLISFVSMSSLDRGATKNYAESLQAEQIAQGGLDQIVSQIQAEIADPKLSTNYLSVIGGGTNNLYIPISGSNAVPQRTAPASTNFATLLTYSGTSLYTTSGSTGATDYSSNSLTSGTSMNGRYITSARWNKPQLTTGTGTPGFPVPKWILMTRTGPQASGSYNSSVANNSVNSGSYVVGRYAYVIYDTSGLLDVNVAGYPTGSSTNAAGKGLMPWADLTQLSGSISQTDIDNLVNWRNSTTSASGSYAANVYTSATNNGFTRVAGGDTVFLGRQELIKYAQTQNPDLVNALPYITTFSRELNGATWGPTTPTNSLTDYAGQQYTAGALNPRIPNPRVLVQTSGSTFIRNNGITAIAGEPLVKYRFPLGKLALLEKFTGTGNGTLTATDITDIQKYFGLDYATDANGPSYRHWVYPTTNNTYKHGVLSGATGIMTLDDVAAQNREPDFFELLQAGILAGSLGVPGKTSSGTPNFGRGDQPPANSNGTETVDSDDIATLQILRIGANIIDQWDADSFPTTITFSPTSTNVYGIEDLPYPFAAYLNVYAPTANTPPFNFYIYYELWNPHQAPTSSVSGSNYPQTFRLTPLYNSGLQNDSDYLYAGFAGLAPNKAVWFFNGSTATNTLLFPSPQFLGNPTSAEQITFPVLPPPATNYREPSLIPASTATMTGTNSTAPSPISNFAYFAPPPLSSFPPTNTRANQSGDGATGEKFPSNPSLYTWSVDVALSLVTRIQYQDNSGNWHTYGTFMGVDDTAGGFTAGTGYYLTGWFVPSSTPTLNALSMVKSDPRTFRLGAGGDYTGPASDVNQPLSTSAGVMNNPVNAVAPFASAGVTASLPYRLDMWAANDGSTPKGPSSPNPYYFDNDHVQRWGDARNSYQSSTPTSPLFTGATNSRPLILNRPFQSVGELGYAFRDMPWKTLDLFSANSADSGLLDLFTMSDAPIVAGRVSPNTPYPQVLAALISGETQSTSGSTTVTTGSAVAQAMQNMTSGAGGPFVNRADLVNRFMTNAAITTTMAPSGIKTEEEAVVRALAESSNTRTWNFMIDIIAQAGRYPSSAGTLDNFAVEGERRYWLHVAVDRYTGQVVDKQLEVVNE